MAFYSPCADNSVISHNIIAYLQTLYSKLDILRSPTEKLVLHFFSDLAKRQYQEMKHGKAQLGTLLISVGYLKQSSIVEVDVIQAEKLPGLEKTNVKYLCNSGEFVLACTNEFLALFHCVFQAHLIHLFS